MRIVMPLFDFDYEDSQEFEFDGGRYALRKFNAGDEIPTIELFSKQDISQIKMVSWALVAEDPDIDKYKGEVNSLLLSFKISKLASLFIKYRLCKEDSHCHIINDTMCSVLPERSAREITLNDLKVINNRFLNLLRMDPFSNRTHNALYFLYLATFSTHWIVHFMFMMNALESLFSKEKKGAATKTICSRVSKFLGSKDRCKYKDIENLYDIRSRIVHGNIKADDDATDNLENSHHLQYVVTECMKKILDEKIHLKYANVEEKERYFNEM